MSDIYLHLQGQTSGPYVPAQLRLMLGEGKISAETPAWHNQLTEWSTVAQVLTQFPPETASLLITHAPIPAPSPLSQPATPPQLVPEREKIHGCLMTSLILLVILFLPLPMIAILAGIALGPINVGIQKAKESATIQYSRTIALAMFQYANDHNGAYPDGATSTEVFQKLIDEKYISDPTVFYVAMPGKIKPTSTRLAQENVSYDVTSGVKAESSDYVPVVFLTGYTVSYTAGASASRDADAATPFPGLAVAYKNNSAAFLKADPDGSVPEVIPPGFDPGLLTYRQLRP